MHASQTPTFMNPSLRLGSAPLFFAQGVRYTVEDALAAAFFRGGMDQAIDETLRMDAAEERADELEVEPDAEELQTSSEAFRSRHNLISAGETEDWLEARGLNTEDFSEWLYRRLCPGAADLTIFTKDLAVPDEFPDLLRVHLWMSGQMEALSRDLSRRVAAALEISQRGETLSTEPVMQRFLARHGLQEGTLPGWLAELNRDRPWLTDMVRIEAAFDRLVSALTTDDGRARQFGSMKSSLARIQVETLDLDSEGAAREAFLSVRDDGLTLAELAREIGYRTERAEIWMDAIDEKIGLRLLGAADGEVIGPLALGSRFKIYHVLRKVEPSLTDPAVVRRLDDVLTDQFFAGLCARHIQAADAARTGR